MPRKRPPASRQREKNEARRKAEQAIDNTYSTLDVLFEELADSWVELNPETFGMPGVAADRNLKAARQLYSDLSAVNRTRQLIKSLVDPR